MVRFAQHVPERDPQNLLARMMVANHTEDAAERRRILKEACTIGWGLWGDYRLAGGRIAWWDEKDTQPFMMATLAYGTELARAGDRDRAALAYRLLLKLDPQDRMGAEAVFAELGVVSAPVGGPGRTM